MTEVPLTGFFLGQKRSSVVTDGHPHTHSKKYPLHVICKSNTAITKINAKKQFVIFFFFFIIFIHERKKQSLSGNIIKLTFIFL